MKTIVSAMFVACAVSVGVAAQGQQPATQTQEPAVESQRPAVPPSASASAQQKVTISGCVQNAPVAAGTTASATTEPKFVLSNPKMTGPAQAVGTTGTTEAKSYRLDGENKTISSQLNHQVEITGTVQPSGASAAHADAGSAAESPMLKIDSVKMLSATCQK